jgi:hypothetical protein
MNYSSIEDDSYSEFNSSVCSVEDDSSVYSAEDEVYS